MSQDLSEAELRLLKEAQLCMHVSAVHHLPEYKTLKDKGLIQEENFSRTPYHVSYYITRTQRGNDLLQQICPK